MSARVLSRYYISSLDGPAQRLLVAARAHWSIESRQNMATLRQMSRNLLKRETSLKVGIQGKRL